jgi:hypothetical protein
MMFDGTGMRFPRKLIDFTVCGLPLAFRAIWCALRQNQVVPAFHGICIKSLYLPKAHAL